jgi:hypothetical protein
MWAVWSDIGEVKSGWFWQASIHAIKSRNSNLASLRDFFCKKYEEGSPSFKLAQVYSQHFLLSVAWLLLCTFQKLIMSIVYCCLIIQVLHLLSHKCSCCPFLCFVPNWHDKKYLAFGSGQFLSWLDSFEATQLIWNPDALYDFLTSCRETLWRAWLAIQSCVIFFRWSFASVLIEYIPLNKHWSDKKNLLWIYLVSTVLNIIHWSSPSWRHYMYK